MVGLGCADVRQLSDLAAAKVGPCGAEMKAVLACEPSPPVQPIQFQF